MGQGKIVLLGNLHGEQSLDTEELFIIRPRAVQLYGGEVEEVALAVLGHGVAEAPVSDLRPVECFSFAVVAPRRSSHFMPSELKMSLSER